MSAGERDDWTTLNRAITDRSLDAASLCQLRRYRKAAHAQGVSVPPALFDNLDRLIAQRWMVIGAVAAIIAAIASVLASVLGLVSMWR